MPHPPTGPGVTGHCGTARIYLARPGPPLSSLTVVVAPYRSAREHETQLPRAVGWCSAEDDEPRRVLTDTIDDLITWCRQGFRWGSDGAPWPLSPAPCHGPAPGA